ncbi:hypothetical protein QJQ45_006789 [Haematococcus lacustris]|nr:hypothetical protein QJQ45_006789 [Haematococcus lacustris]
MHPIAMKVTLVPPATPHGLQELEWSDVEGTVDTGKLANHGSGTDRTVETDGASVCVHYARFLPNPPPPPPAAGIPQEPQQALVASDLNNARLNRRNTQLWLAPTQPHLQRLAPASSAGTSLEANLKHITVTLATWNAVWEVYLDPEWARQRLRLERLFEKVVVGGWLVEEVAEVSMERHKRVKQLTVYFGMAGICTRGGWGADVVLRACCKVACRPRGTDQRRGRVVPVDELFTSQPPCSQAASQPAASEPGPSTPPPAKRSKCTKAEQAAEPTQPNKGIGKGKVNAAKARPTPQPGRWLNRDCNAALNIQRIGESRWRPLELCWWPGQAALPAKGRDYPGLGYKRASGLNSARLNTKRWLAPIQPHLENLAAASSAGTSLEANLTHINVTLATWDAVWDVYLDPKWARQRLRLYGAQDRALEQVFEKVRVAEVAEVAEVSMERQKRAKQLVVFFAAAGIGTRGGWGADAVLRACCKVPPCSQAATQPAASEPGPSTPPPAKRSKRTMAVQAAEPTQPNKGIGKGKVNAAKAKPTPQPGMWLDRDCNAALNMQRIGESRWRPLELCWWPDQAALPAKGREYPGLGYKRRAVQTQPQPAPLLQMVQTQQARTQPERRQLTAPAMTQHDMQHQAALDGGAIATDGYNPAGEPPPPATRLLDLPPALLDDIACRGMQLGARSLLPLTCHAFSQAHLLHDPALRIQLGRQCCDHLLMPRVVAALQARTSKLSLTLWQPETEDSVYYRKQLAPTLQLPQTEYTQNYTSLLVHALAKLKSCAAVEVCNLVSSGAPFDDYSKYLHCPPGLAQDLLDSFPSLTALTMQGLRVSSDALASLLSHPRLARQLQQLHLTNTSILGGDELGAVGPVFLGLHLRQLSIDAEHPVQPGTPPLPDFQPLAQHLTQLHLNLCVMSFFKEYLQPLAQLQVLTITHLKELEGLTEVLQALPQLHTLQLPRTSIKGTQELDTLLAATRLTSIQLDSIKALDTSYVDVPCNWQRLELLGIIDRKAITYLPLHSLSQPLVLGRLDISVRDISDPDMAMALHRLAHACKVPVQIKEVRLRLRSSELSLALLQQQRMDLAQLVSLDSLVYQCCGDMIDDDDDERTGASAISPALLQQQRVAMAQLVALLQPLQCCCEGKVVVHDLHEVTAADVLALAPLCTGCTHLTLYGGSLDPSLEFWRQLVHLMPAVHDVAFFNVKECYCAAMHESLQLMAQQPWARRLHVIIRHKYTVTASELPSCWQAGSWLKAGIIKQVTFWSEAGAASEAMCESLRLMAEQPWARWLDIKVSAAGRPLPACCLDMNKVSNNPPQPGRIKAVFGAQCQWLWLGHCTGAEHDGGAGSWQAVVGVGIDPDVTQAVSAASGVGYEKSGQLEADQLAWWKLTEVQVRQASGLINACRNTQRWLATTQPHTPTN